MCRYAVHTLTRSDFDMTMLKLKGMGYSWFGHSKPEVREYRHLRAHPLRLAITIEDEFICGDIDTIRALGYKIVGINEFIRNTYDKDGENDKKDKKEERS